MASAISNSTQSFETARTSPSRGIMDLILYANRLEELSETMSDTIELSMVNSSTAPSEVDQKTIGGQSAAQFVTAQRVTNCSSSGSSSSSNNNSPRGGGVGGGLPPDNEGKETRKQMLERRRKECIVDEVGVALAPVMKIPVSYCFYPEQYKRFRMLFPRVNIDSGLSYTHHDHPVAHTATLVGIRRMQQMLKPGSLALDIHGNPNGNERFNDFQASRVRKRPHLPKPAHIETLVEERVAADAVRRETKWGPQWRGDEPRWIKSKLEDIPPWRYDTFLSCHTLYYYSMSQVCKLLHDNPRSTMIALVNYSKEQTGTLYGELQFSKQGGMTVQTSPNGECYKHPDIDQWFQTNTFRGVTQNVNSGISWTSVNIGGPLYLITIVRCDWDLARLARYDPPAAPTLQVSADRSFFGMVRIRGADVRLRVTNAGLASELRHFMTFRDRANPQTFLDLCVKARRVTTSDLVDGSRQYEVGDGELQDHIVYAYLVDAPGELELLDGVKLLRGDLLEPLAQSLKLEGVDKKIGLMEAIFWHLAGRSTYKQALKSRLKPSGGNALSGKQQNTAGLLPTTRT